MEPIRDKVKGEKGTIRNQSPSERGVAAVMDYATSNGRFVSPEEMAEATGGARDAADFTDARKRAYGIDERDENGDPKWFHYWAGDPNSPTFRNEVNRVQQIKDAYPGADLIIDPETGEEVRLHDTVAMKIPYEYKRRQEEAEIFRMNGWLAANPETAGGLGMDDDSIYELIHRYGGTTEGNEILRLRDEMVSVEDARNPDKLRRLKAMAQERRQTYQRRMLQADRTFKMTFHEAYESERRIFARQNGLGDPSSKKVDSAFQEHLDEIGRESMRGGIPAGNRDWKSQVDAMRKGSGRSTFNVPAEFGRPSKQLEHSRKLDAQRQRRNG